MLWIGLGFCALLAVLLGLRAAGRADPVALAKGLRYGGAAVLFLLAGMLVLTGRAVVAAPLAGWAILLLRQQKPASSADTRKQKAGSAGRRPARPQWSGMGREVALEILGLQPGATEYEIREAHSRLMQACHPDKGGSNYLAARLNAARDRLISN